MKIIKIVLFLGILAAIVYVLNAPVSENDLRDLPVGNRAGRSAVREKRDYAAFLAKMDGNRVFTAVARSAALASGGKDTIAKVIEGLRLAGIMTAGGTKAIIEDKESSETYYVKQGQTLAGLPQSH